MKYIHVPTLIIHGLLLVLAGTVIHDYPDFFLGFSILILIFHTGWAIESDRNFLPAHAIGTAVQLLAERLGLLTFAGGFYGMGSEFGWFFYCIALVFSLAIQLVVALIKARRRK